MQGMKGSLGQLYPVALDVRGKTCVVVGGGAVGLRKALGLAEAGADVLVVAPKASEKLQGYVEEGRFRYVKASFEPIHLNGAFLVVAATDRPDVNTAVAHAAKTQGALLNLAAPAGEREEEGDFIAMATVRRGDLLLALTTNGAGPALAARLKSDLEERFGPEWGPYVDLLREMRAEAYRRYDSAEEAARSLRHLVRNDTIREKLAAGDTLAAREEALACLLR